MKNLEPILFEFDSSDFKILKQQINLNLYDIVYGDNNISIVDKLYCEKGIVELKIIKKHNNLNNDEFISIKNKQNNNCELKNNESEEWEDLMEYLKPKKENKNLKEIKINEFENELTKKEILLHENEKYSKLLIETINTLADKEIKLKEIQKSKDLYEEYIKDMKNQLKDIINKIEEKSKIRDKLNNEIENNKEKELIILEIEKKKQEKELIILEIEKKKKEYDSIIEEIKKNNIFLEKQRKLINIMEEKYKSENEIRDYKIEFEKKIKLLLNKIENKFLEEIKDINEQKINLYLKELEIKRNEKFNEMMRINEKNKLELINISKLNNVKHNNKKCKKCGEDPIEGILYKCSECREYYLLKNVEKIQLKEYYINVLNVENIIYVKNVNK